MALAPPIGRLLSVGFVHIRCHKKPLTLDSWISQFVDRHQQIDEGDGGVLSDDRGNGSPIDEMLSVIVNREIVAFVDVRFKWLS